MKQLGEMSLISLIIWLHFYKFKFMFSALDSKSEKLVQETINNVIKGHTVSIMIQSES